MAFNNIEKVELLQDFESQAEDINHMELLQPRKSASNVNRLLLVALSVCLVVSIVINIVQSLRIDTIQTAVQGCSSFMLNQLPSKEVTFGINSDFGNATDLNEVDRLWNSLFPETGMVAIPKTDDLPEAVRFPWDPSKKVYLLNGYHGLHCLQRLYNSLRQFQTGAPQTEAFAHLVHCLDALRQDVMCTADDTPWLAGGPKLDKQLAAAGKTRMVQTRVCRDWSQLEAWATENSACFRQAPPGDPKAGTIDEWKYCPEGSMYREKVERYFNQRDGEDYESQADS